MLWRHCITQVYRRAEITTRDSSFFSLYLRGGVSVAAADVTDPRLHNLQGELQGVEGREKAKNKPGRKESRGEVETKEREVKKLC